ncbi:MAG: long-chain fatty acid--CoA ligase [bacterium]|nr:long-chain fatty acid--CoA ligase [bacterium]
MIELNGATMPEIFQNQTIKYGDRACVAFKNTQTRSFEDISWNTMNERVRNLAGFLLSKGIKKGDKIGLFSPNRPEWWIVDLAALSIGAVNVPIYATNSADETFYVLKHSESRICFVGEEEHCDKTLEVAKKLPKLSDIVIFDDLPKKKKGVITLEEALKKGSAYKKKGDFDKRLKAVKPSDIATIIYTSGTTGDPKGVMLSHNNFVSNARQILTLVEEYVDDRHSYLSFLPLSHSLERTAGYYFPMAAGCTVAFAEEFSKVIENMAEIRPTMIISVPRLYEKIHSTILSRLPDASLFKRTLFKMAMATAAKNMHYVCTDKEPKGLFAFQVNLFNKLVFSKIKAGLGMENMEYAVSGGAPLSVSDAEFFIGMGIKITEGFGLTETTPVTNVNPPWKIKPGSVGPPVPETEIRIADDGEYQIKGPQVMLGYYKNKKATEEAFTKDGFFRTGDMALIDPDGFVSITGRIKDIIVTAGGKNISPQNIENSCKASPFIEQVAIIGDRRKYLSALIIPAFDSLEKWAATNDIEFANYTELVNTPEVQKLFENELAANTMNFARVEQIRKFTLLDAEWTQETGELTASLKVKRMVLEEKYQNIIEGMYPSE